MMRLSGLTMCSETTPGAFVLQQIRPHCPDEESDTRLKSGSVFFSLQKLLVNVEEVFKPHHLHHPEH